MLAVPDGYLTSVMSNKKRKSPSQTARLKACEEYEEEFEREFPDNVKTKRGPRFENQPLRNVVEHCEEKPENAYIFVERMMTLGFSFGAISDACMTKYNMKYPAVRKMIDRIRKDWIVFTKLPDDEKKAEIETQINNVMRLSLEAGEFNVASLLIKRKMELNGLQPTKGTPTQAGLTINNLLGEDLVAQRNQKLLEAKKKGE